MQAGWCLTTVLGFRKRGTAAGRKKKGLEKWERDLVTALLPSLQAEQGLCLPATADPGSP